MRAVLLRAAAVSATALALGPGTAAASPPSRVPARPPHVLPGDAGAASARDWIVAARGGPARRLAGRFGAQAVTSHGAYRVPRARARAFAAALRAHGRLAFAEPDVPGRRVAEEAPAPLRDPLSPEAPWRDTVVAPGVTAPTVTDDSPVLGLVDQPADLSHPELAGHVTSAARTPPAPYGDHGTGTAAVASAPVNGQGFVGIWPGMRVLNVPVSDRIPCSESANAIDAAIARRVAVINMSYGSDVVCFLEYLEVQYAVAAGIVPVAAAGNEMEEGNPLEFPASLPHVLTVGAVGPDLQHAYFSNANAAVDIAAPGEGILTAAPPAFDTDGTPDGYEVVDGTSVSAPMVAAAATWLRAARPGLTGGQVADVLRLSARDVGRGGWDPGTGYGLLDVGAALSEPAPPADPLEPNDEIAWVDGTAFRRPTPAIWHGRGTRPFRLDAALDEYEDPLDVYPISVPRRARVVVRVRSLGGDADLDVLDSGARSSRSRRHRLGRSHHGGTRAERVVVHNRAHHAARAYVVVSVDPRGHGLDARYRLHLKRRR